MLKLSDVRCWIVTLIMLCSGTSPAAPESLEGLAKIFPKAEILQAGGRELLSIRIAEVLQSISRDSGGKYTEIAFVLDRSQTENLGTGLQLALAANRDKLVNGRFALVVCAAIEGARLAQIKVSLGADPYAVLSAAGHIDWQPEGNGLGASVSGLATATELGWNPKQARPHIVLLLDDLLQAGSKAEPVQNKADDIMLSKIRAWARANQATLHIIRGMLGQHDGRGDDTSEDSLERRHLVSLEQVAGLFSDSHYIKAASQSELSTAIEQALPKAGPNDRVDLALLIDSSGLMGEKAASLRAEHAVFERFLSAQQKHRVALILFSDKGKPKTVLPLTSKKNSVTSALLSLRRGNTGDWPKDISAAILAARKLCWAPTAKKAIIIFTAAASEGGIAQSLLDWAQAQKLAVTVIEP